MITPEQARQVLDTPMQPNDAEAATIRDYLVKLLTQVWEELDNFSGKRPFGNSGWEWEVHEALFRAGLIEGVWQDEETMQEADENAGDELVLAAIAELGKA
jgi:hypothetical protein